MRGSLRVYMGGSVRVYMGGSVRACARVWLGRWVGVGWGGVGCGVGVCVCVCVCVWGGGAFLSARKTDIDITSHEITEGTTPSIMF